MKLQSPQNSKVEPPTANVIKVNANVVVFSNKGCGLGVIIQNAQGEIATSAHKVLAGPLFPELAEAKALIYRSS